MDAAAAAVKERVDVKVLTQRDFPKTALVKAFTDDESSCLFATAGFFKASTSRVEPCRWSPSTAFRSAPRRPVADSAVSCWVRGFGEIDLRAAMLLAQATGRLIRNATDRGVVAVFDPRLGKANYRWQVVNALPPMKRTRERSEVEAFLREITS
jgi:ATP-dependent DNA helicase DinG